MTEQHSQANVRDVAAQDKNIELQREVRWHEEQRLKEYERLEAVQLSARSAERPVAVVHGDRAAHTMSADPRQMLAGAQNGLGGQEDAGTGTDSEEEGDDGELASYSRIHGLTQPWPSEQPGPSRQRRLWDAARNHGTSGADAAQDGPPRHARGGYAADDARSRGEGSAVRKDRASVSWDVLPDAPGAVADADNVDEQSLRQQHDDYAADDRWNSGYTRAATGSGRNEDLLGGYSQLPHRAHAGISKQPHEVLGPARSVSPSRAPSRQHAKRAEPSIRRAWAPRSGAPDDDTAGSQELASAAETHASGKQHSASGQHTDGDSRAYWRRFAADTVAQDSSAAACNRDSWGRAHDEHAGHGHMPATMPQIKISEHAHGTVSGAAVRRAAEAGSGQDVRRKVRIVVLSKVLIASAGRSAPRDVHITTCMWKEVRGSRWRAHFHRSPQPRACFTGQYFKRAADGLHR